MNRVTTYIIYFLPFFALSCGTNEYYDYTAQTCRCQANFIRRIRDARCIPEKSAKISDSAAPFGWTLPGDLPTDLFLLKFWVYTSSSSMNDPSSIIFFERKNQIKFFLDATGAYVLELIFSDGSMSTVISPIERHQPDKWILLVLNFKHNDNFLYGFSGLTQIFSGDLTDKNLVYRDGTLNFTLCKNCGQMKQLKVFALPPGSFTEYSLKALLYYYDDPANDIGEMTYMRYDFMESEGTNVNEYNENILQHDLGTSIEWVDNQIGLCDIWSEIYDPSQIGQRKCKARNDKDTVINVRLNGMIVLPYSASMTIASKSGLLQIWLKNTDPSINQDKQYIAELCGMLKLYLLPPPIATYTIITANNVKRDAPANFNVWQCLQLFLGAQYIYIYLDGVLYGNMLYKASTNFQYVFNFGNTAGGSKSDAYEGSIRQVSCNFFCWSYKEFF